jgi:PleD family two-component response regulator
MDNEKLEDSELTENSESSSETNEEKEVDSVENEKEISKENVEDITPNSENTENSSSDDNSDMSEALDKYPIVVIDDDRWIQRIFNQYLKNWGFEYIAASNSFEGLDLSIKNKPLIIFLDIIMPDVTGDITLKFIRGIEELAQTPVVIISGNLNKDVLKSTYKDGATGFISKPFTKEILYQKIKDVLDPKIYNRMVHDGLIDPKAIKSTTLNV